MLAVKKTRLTAAGNICAYPAMLHWLIVTNWDGDPRHVVLNDATSGTTGEVSKFYVASDRTEVFSFNPPIPCSTGIRIGTFEESAMEVTGGYSGEGQHV